MQKCNETKILVDGVLVTKLILAKIAKKYEGLKTYSLPQFNFAKNMILIYRKNNQNGTYLICNVLYGTMEKYGPK